MELVREIEAAPPDDRLPTLPPPLVLTGPSRVQ
jgi:hypothetical protein